MPEPTEAYGRSVAEQRAHHARSKTFSGSLLLPHRLFLVDLANRLHCDSGLDYGCGKGQQYEVPLLVPQELGGFHGMTFESALGFRPYRYDPALPEFATPPDPDAKFDLVIVSHVLFWIPSEDLRTWVLPRIFGHAARAVFIAEKIGEEKKRFLSQREAHPRGLHAFDWIDMLLPVRRQYPNVECHLATGYRAADGQLYTGRWEL